MDITALPMTDAMLASIRLSTKCWVKYIGLVSNPEQALHYAKIGGGIATEVARLALMVNDSPTRFKGQPGTSKRATWSKPISLPEVKAVGKVLGCSVNDMLLAAGCVSFVLGDAD